MKFPILFKHKKVFIWYSNHWINIPLMAQANGDGIKGYYHFFKGLIACIFGKHRYIHVFRLKDMERSLECSYCWKEKEIEIKKDTLV